MLVVKIKYRCKVDENIYPIYFKGNQQECAQFIKSCEKQRIRSVDWIESDSLEYIADEYEKASYKSSIDVLGTLLYISTRAVPLPPKES